MAVGRLRGNLIRGHEIWFNGVPFFLENDDGDDGDDGDASDDGDDSDLPLPD